MLNTLPQITYIEMILPEEVNIISNSRGRKSLICLVIKEVYIQSIYGQAVALSKAIKGKA